MYKLANNVSFKVVEERGFIVNVDTGKIFSINRTATTIVEGIVKGLNTDAIKKQISDEYNVEIGRFEEDINKYIKLLFLNGIIEEI